MRKFLAFAAVAFAFWPTLEFAFWNTLLLWFSPTHAYAFAQRELAELPDVAVVAAVNALVIYACCRSVQVSAVWLARKLRPATCLYSRPRQLSARKSF
jgi:hypothetical protein